MRDLAAALDFTDKTIVITGLSGGLGTGMANAFSQAGARVIGIDQVDDDNRSREVVHADISDAADVARAFEAIDQLVDRIDVLINNAGVREVKTVLELTPAEWDRVIDVNLNGTFYCSREAALRMRESGGSIIATASVAGHLGITHRPAYVAAKHAVIGLTKNLAVDLAPYGIRANAIAPGTIRTPMTEKYWADARFVEDFERTVPLGATGAPVDVAGAALYLASPLASYVTGTTLVVDGGWSSSKAFTYGESSAYTSSTSTKL